jgi:peptidoglycan/xylan/chitin deacetylase (PgdA/CDA1 family)
MSLRHYLGSLRRSALCSLYRRNVPLGKSGPIISFTFDDFPRTAYLVGGAILEQFGARGTYYVTPGLMNASNELGQLCGAEDLRDLLRKGHELGTQTFYHSSCRSVSLDAFRNDVQKGMKAIEQINGHNSANFAYPYGHVTLRTKKALGPELNSCRSNIPGLNGPEVDLSLLRANKLYGGSQENKQIQDLILQNVREKSWLIFYTHDVRLSHSDYGCTPALFEFAVSFAARSGSRILTVQQVLHDQLTKSHDMSIAPAETAHLRS